MKKQNLTQQKHTFTNQNKYTTTQNKHKKLTPGLVTSYDIWRGNGDGLFWFRHFINLSLTYLLRHLPTYFQPGTHTPGAWVLFGQSEHPKIWSWFYMTKTHCTVCVHHVP